MAKFVVQNASVRVVDKPESPNNGQRYIDCLLQLKGFDFNRAVRHFFFFGGNKTIESKYIGMVTEDGRMLDPETNEEWVVNGVKVRYEPEEPFFKKHTQTRFTSRGKATKEGEYVEDANGNPQLYKKQTIFCMQYWDEDEGRMAFADDNHPDEVFGRMLREIFVPAVKAPSLIEPGKTEWVTPEEAKKRFAGMGLPSYHPEVENTKEDADGISYKQGQDDKSHKNPPRVNPETGKEMIWIEQLQKWVDKPE